MSPREKGRRECTVAITWPAVSGRVITFWVFPERKPSSTSKKSREGGCSFSLRETSYTYMYLCTYVFFYSVTGRLPTTRQAGSIRK